MQSSFVHAAPQDEYQNGDRDGAVALFQAEVAGLPAQIIDGMRGSPMGGWFTGLARTLPHDVILCGPGTRARRASWQPLAQR